MIITCNCGEKVTLQIIHACNWKDGSMALWIKWKQFLWVKLKNSIKRSSKKGGFKNSAYPAKNTKTESKKNNPKKPEK